MKFSFTVEPVTFSSNVQRGELVSRTLFEPMMQSYAELGVARLGPGELVAGIGAIEMFGSNSRAEYQPYVTYAFALGMFELQPGYAVDFIPELEQVDSVHEFSLQTRLRWDFPIVPYVGAAVDPVRTMGVYASVGAASSFAWRTITLMTMVNFGASEYANQSYSLQDITLSARGVAPFSDSGYYAALTVASAWSGRARELYPYSGVSIGYTR